MPVCTTLPMPLLFADYEKMSRHFKNIYFKVCQIPFVDGQNDHHTTVVKFIRDYANDNNPTGWTPLHWAAIHGDKLTVLLILLYAKDKKHADNAGETPLHWAAMKGQLEIVKLLLEHAKDKNPADNDGGATKTDLVDEVFGIYMLWGIQKQCDNFWVNSSLCMMWTGSLFSLVSNIAQWGKCPFLRQIKNGHFGLLLRPPRLCLTFLERGRRDESKMVRHDLRLPRRPELKAELSVFNLAQKRSFPPLWHSNNCLHMIG
jgi:hypothetical protein